MKCGVWFLQVVFAKEGERYSLTVPTSSKKCKYIAALGTSEPRILYVFNFHLFYI